MDKVVLSKMFLQQAQQDLKASKLLYNNNYYPQSIFLLQQATEKATKSIYLLQPDITENDLFKIRHKPIDIYKKLVIKAFKGVINPNESITDSQIESFEDKLKNEVTYNVYRFKINYTAYNKELNDIKIDSNKIKLPLRRLDKYVKKMQIVKKDYETGLKSLSSADFSNFNIAKMRNELMGYMLRLIEHVKSKYDLDEKKEQQMLDVWAIEIDKALIFFQKNGDLTKQVYVNLLRFTYANNLLIYLSIITQKHAEARYPTSEFIPMEFYTKDIPIIKRYKMIFEFLENAIDSLELYLNYIDKSMDKA